MPISFFVKPSKTTAVAVSLSLVGGAMMLLPAACAQAQTHAEVAPATANAPTATTPSEVSALPTPASIAALRRAVAGDAATQKAWERVRRIAEESLQKTPRPQAKISYEGLLGQVPRRQESTRRLQDMSRVEMLDQAYAVTGETKYRDKAREFVVAWAKTYLPDGNPINENKLMPALLSFATHQESYPAAERKLVADWIEKIGRAEIATTARNRENNWHTKRIGLVAIAGRALNNDEFLQYAIDESKLYVQNSLRPDGSSIDFEQRDALSYHFGGLKPFIRAAALLPTEKFDLWNYQAPSGASIRKSVEFVLPYVRGEKTHEEYKNSKVDIDIRRKKAGEIKEGQMFEPKKATETLVLASAYDAQYAPTAQKLIAEGGIKAPSDAGDSISLGYDPNWLLALSRAGWALEPTD